MSTTTINIPDMHCAACENKIRRVLQSLGAITRLQFNPVRRQLFITHTDAIQPVTLLGLIEKAGFQPALLTAAGAQSPVDRTLLKRLGVAGLAMMQVMMLQIALYAGAFQGMQSGMQRLLEFTALLFCIPVVTYSAIPFFRQALRWRHGVNMDTPIALAIAIAFATSLVNTWRGSGDVYYDSVVMFTFLMLGARFIDQRLRGHLQLQDNLLAALPRKVQRLSQDSAANNISNLQTIHINDIRLNDVLWIEQGQQLPADGYLLDASATLDEALLTGEAGWRTHSRGHHLYAGTFNRGPGLRLQVHTLPQHSRVAAIDNLANTALAEKHSVARWADRVARVFIPVVLVLAAATAALWMWVDPSQALSASLAVLVVSCPCALSLATPAALNAALVGLRRLGIMVTNPRALEVADLEQVFIDKTGTLTDATSRIVLTTPPVPLQENLTPQDCLAMAAALQHHTNHPLASAFAESAQKLPSLPSATDVELVPGQGVRGQIDGRAVAVGSAQLCAFPATNPHSEYKQVYLSVDGKPAAVFSLHNPLREDASLLIDGLQAQHLPVTLLSGDSTERCAALAAELHIDYCAAALPEEKTARVADSPSLFIGDGLNDLAALAAADVSIAMSETPDLVKSKADVILLTPRLTAVLDYLNVARYCRRIMRQNLAWALCYNLLAIPAAALGYAPPWLAALGMSTSSLLVMLNACRILRPTTAGGKP